MNSDAPDYEKERLRELESYNIMDSETEEDFDNLASLASEICKTNISMVSLLDDKRQWFKSTCGFNVRETPKEQAFCAHAIKYPNEPFIVPDARKDHRFSDNPLVVAEPFVVFYAGIPLISENGFPLGTLCVLDHKPKELSKEQLEALKKLARQAMKLLELRKKTIELEKKNVLLQRKNEEIERFASAAAHDLKSPLNNIRTIIDLLIKEAPNDSDALEMLGMVENSIDRLSRLIADLLEFSRIDVISFEDVGEVNLEDLMEDLKSAIVMDTSCAIQLVTSLNFINVNRAGLWMILQNLVTNSIKYCDKPNAVIEIGIQDDGTQYKCYVKDNGPGIADKFKDQIFEPFKTLNSKDRFGNKGSGLGLANVKKVVEKLDGKIDLESEIGKGTTFTFWLKKHDKM